jgi:hypothetical protein
MNLRLFVFLRPRLRFSSVHARHTSRHNAVLLLLLLELLEATQPARNGFTTRPPVAAEEDDLAEQARKDAVAA